MYHCREGDISLIEADAITNTTDETLTEKNIISNRIYRRAGPGLREEIKNDLKGIIRQKTKKIWQFIWIEWIIHRTSAHIFTFILSLSFPADCKTGDVRVTKGYNLPSKYIIHTVGPIYSERYKTAAENTLYTCYRWISFLLCHNLPLTSNRRCFTQSHCRIGPNDRNEGFYF